MKTQRSFMFALVGVCGLASSLVVAQSTTQPSRQPTNPSNSQPHQPAKDSDSMRGNQPNMRNDAPAVDRGNSTIGSASSPISLMYYSKLRGTNIRNADGKTVFEIKDAILDRHSGEIAAYVVSGNRVVYPSEVMVGSDSKGARTWRTNVSQEALKNRQEFRKDAFDSDQQTSSKVSKWWSDFDAGYSKGNNSNTNPYQNERFGGGKAEELTGEIIAIDRVRGESNAYRSVAEVRLGDGSTRKVVLGPSWYLAEKNAMPMRGQTITLNAAPVQGVQGAEWAATNYTIKGSEQVNLREGDKYTPSWQQDKYAKNSMQRRMIRASELMGNDVKCLDELSGEVEDLVVDVSSGRVLALVIDPNENFLGMMDTTRLIPLSVTSASASGLIYVDANKEMITKAPAAPSNLDELGANWQLDSVYNQRPISAR